MVSLRHYPQTPDARVLQREHDAAPEVTFSISTASAEWLAARSERAYTSNSRSLLDLARIAYALQRPEAEVTHHLRESSDCFVRGITEGAPFHLDDHFEQLEIVVILGAHERAQALADLPADRHVVRGVTYPDSAEREFEILTDLVTGREIQATARMPKAVQTLEKDRLPRAGHEDIASALDVQAQILARDQEGLSRALQRRHEAWAAKFAKPDLASHPRGLMDLNGLALCALARRARLTPWDGSVYMPLSLLQG